MRRRGINYDTGFAPFGDKLSRESFVPAEVRREMGIIARELHCNATRITGLHVDRIALAAECALEEGLEVWFSPFPCNMTEAELLPYFGAGARVAERLRRASRDVVFVLGCEMTMFDSGFIPGNSYTERMQFLMNPAAAGAEFSPEALVQRFQSFLRRALEVVRAEFGGPLTYASGPWEPVEWSRFDIVAVDHYRNAGNRAAYRDQLRQYFKHGRPVVVSELGCCTYRGAPDRGALGWTVVDRSAQPPRLREPVMRDEQVQADELVDLLQILEEEGVDGAFWFTFAGYNYPHHADPETDLDCASYGLVKVLDGARGQIYPGLPWEPKRAFAALAREYGRGR